MDSLRQNNGSPAADNAVGPYERLEKLGLKLPRIPSPVGNFELGVFDGDKLVLSGQGPLLDDGTMATGKVGAEVSVEQAYHHAECTGLVLIGVIQELLGSLDRVEQIIKVFGMVNAVPEFAEHPKVINGCSDLFRNIFGDRGRHARCAIGVGSLPGNISVEIEAVIRVSHDRTLTE